MKDWKGNEIKVGDTVVLVFTGAPKFTCRLVFSTIDKTYELPETEVEESYEWQVVEEYEIIEYSNYFTSRVIPINLINLISKSIGQILCIKGVSDNMEDYYNEKFKV